MQTIELLPHQHEFIHATEKVVGLICGIGAGKSFAGRIWIIKKAIENPETLGFIGANTYAQLRDTILNPLMAELETMGLPHNYNANTGILTIGDAKIKCASLENFNVLRGIEIGYGWLDEIRDLNEEAFLMMLGRLRCGKSHKLEMRATTTPAGYNWIYDLFAGTRKTADFRMIHATSKANIFLPDGYLDTLTANYDDRFKEQELEGSFVNLSSGKIYHAFSREAHVKELPDAYYTHDYLSIGMDFNVNPLCAVIAVVTDTRIYVIDEMYLNNSNTFAGAEHIKLAYPRRRITVIPDATGKNRKTSALNSDHAILQQAGFRVRAPRINPRREDRFNTVNKLLEEGCLIIDPRCKMLIKDLEQEVADKNPKDIGHINDALGYLCYDFKPLAPVRKRSSTTTFN